jgi:VWFA-related protein
MTIHQTTHRVLVDVVVTDAKGKPIKGLKKEDFVVKEDGKPQQILSFDFEDISAPTFAPPKLPDMPANTFVNLPKEPERGPLYVLYYDMVNTEPQDQAMFHKELLDFIDKAPSGTRFCLFVNAAGLHLIQGFTSDRAQLQAAVLSKGPGPHLPSIFLNGDNFGWQDIGAALSNFHFMAEYLEGIPGRKNLIWLSDEFPMPFGPTGNDWTTVDQDNVRQTFAALMRSQIAIYPVDLKGVVLAEVRGASPAGDAAGDFSSTAGPNAPAGPGSTGDNADSSGLPANPNSGQAMGLSGASVTSLDQNQEDYIADSTGGHASYSDNRSHLAMEEAVERGETYYSLSYSPSNDKYDGLKRNIHVELANGSKSGSGAYTLAYRKFYFGLPDGSQLATHKPGSPDARFLAAKEQDPFNANVEHGGPMLHDLIFRVHLGIAGPAALATPDQMAGIQTEPAFLRGGSKNKPAKPMAPVKLQKYLLDYKVLEPKTKVIEDQIGSTATLEFVAVAYDADGVMLNGTLNEANVTSLGETDGKSATTFGAQQEFYVPPGAFWIRLAVRDKATGHIGTLEVPLPLKTEQVDQASN